MGEEQKQQPTPLVNHARLEAAVEAERLRNLGWSEEEIDKALGAWRP